MEHCFCGALGISRCHHGRDIKILSKEAKRKRLEKQGVVSKRTTKESTSAD